MEEALRRVALLEHAVAKHRDALAEGHRLDLVVRHVDGRHPEPIVQARQFGAHRDAQLGVEVGERLVHQEGRRLADHRAAHRDALALAAGEERGATLEQRLQAERRGDVPYTRLERSARARGGA